MQDSLEAFINFTNNSENATNSSKDKTNAAINKKIQSDQTAIRIVEFAIEGRLKPEVFITSLNYINQDFYSDIVEERYVTHICGYAICGNKLSDTPNKTYYISTKANKVYDITERKKFCSNFCYKASEYIKRQIDQTPLCYRNIEDCPKYKLLLATEKGCPGEEVLNNPLKPPVNEPFTSVSAFAEASLEEATENGEFTEKVRKETPKDTDIPPVDEQKAKLKDEVAELLDRMKSELVITPPTNPVQKSPNKPKDLQKLREEMKQKLAKVQKIQKSSKCIVIDTKANPELKIQTSPKKRTKSLKKIDNTPITDNWDYIYTCFTEWISLDSLVNLHGLENITKFTSNRLLNHIDSPKLPAEIANLPDVKQSRYRDLCRRLQLQDLYDAKIDNKVLKGEGSGVSGSSSSYLRPLPDYDTLRAESADLKVKVKAYLGGATSYRSETTEDEKLENNEVDNQVPIVLPQVDNNCHNSIRMRIYVNAVSRFIQTHLNEMNLDASLYDSIKSFIHTFHLKSNNIVFKPAIWNIIALLLIKCMSINNESIAKQLQTEENFAYITSILSNSEDISVRIDLYLRDIESFFANYISSET